MVKSIYLTTAGLIILLFLCLIWLFGKMTWIDVTAFIAINYVMGLGCLGLREMGKAIDFLDKVRELDINHQGGQIHRNLCAV